MRKMVDGEYVDLTLDEIDEHNANLPTQEELDLIAEQEAWTNYKNSKDADGKAKWKQRGKPSFVDDVV